MDKPTPDPAKLLGYWEEWERGDTPPGKVLSNLKTSGMPDLLKSLLEGQLNTLRMRDKKLSPSVSHSHPHFQ